MIGKTFSHFRVTARLGAGGMGEVYRATDERLHRDVALKLLPAEVADDAERLARFEREARLLAALNHPHIAGIHGVEEVEGRPVLVLELVEGEDLAAILARGPLPVARALKLAAQVAAALEAAHRRGIVHRDVKPSNVRVDPDGRAKVLDLGLAKALSPEAEPREPGGRTETVQLGDTAEGVIVGTAPYMSPEQARGLPADHQTDVWAWGCLLYEMLAGKRAFEGPTLSDTLAAVLQGEPDWSRLPDGVPPAVRRLLRRCLAKERERRLHALGDARIEIEDALDPLAPDAGRTAAGRRATTGLWVAAALAAGTAVGALWASARSGPSESPTRVRFTIHLPAELTTPELDALAISPDGRTIAVTAIDPAGRSSIYMRPLDAADAVPVPGTEGGGAPFFSPDGLSLGFHRQGEVRAAPLDGGPVATLGHSGSPALRASLWDAEGLVYPAGNVVGGLRQVASGSTEPETLTDPRERGELAHFRPVRVPGGRWLIFTTWTVEGWQVVARSSEDGTWREVVAGREGSFLPPASIAYLEGSTLMVAPFDPVGARLTGPAAPVLEGVATYVVSDDGTLAYRPESSGTQELVLVDRNGQGSERVAPRTGQFYTPRFSPDGKLLAYTEQRMAEGAVTTVVDLERGARWTLATEGVINNAPTWSPDGGEIAFNSARRVPGIYRVPTDDSGSARLLLERGDDPQVPSAWSPDGQRLLFDQLTRETRRDVWQLPLAADQPPQPFLATAADEHSPSFSPDGRWLAYVSDESGRPEVYVRAFPGPGGKRILSTSGGREPRFSRTGDELLYLEGTRLMSVPIRYEPALRAGRPRALFDVPDLALSRFGSYDMRPDGERFALVRRVAPDPRASEVRVAVGWVDSVLEQVLAGAAGR